MLRYISDRRSLAVVSLYFISTTAHWIYFPEGYFFALFLVVNCLLSFLCAVITHNTIHCPIFKKRGFNRFFQMILSLSYGHPVSAYVSGHNYSHHKHTQSYRDNIRTTKINFRWNFLNQLLFFYRMGGDILTNEIRFAKLMRKEKPKWFRQYMNEFYLVFGIKILLLIVDWQKCLFVLILPHQYAVWGVIGTNYWQHDGCDPDHKFNHTRSFTGKLLNYIAFNNGYHGMHHRNPGLHWSLLPAFHKKYIEPNIHPNLNRRSLIAYLWESCIWPGRRVRFDGEPVVIPKKRKDADWIKYVQPSVERGSLGAEI